MGMQFDSHFNWHEIAAFLGFPEAAAKLQSVCAQTKWRRMMGKTTAGVQQFTAALTTSRGGVAGPLGSHLLLAVVNLVAMSLQDSVAQQLDQSKEQEVSKRRKQEKELGAKNTEEAAVSEPIRDLRREYISFLAREFPGKDRLNQSALLER